MTRNEVIELLDRYNKLLVDEGYCDNDIRCEPPTAIDQFLNTTWAKENIKLELNITQVKDFGRTDRKDLSIHIEQLKEESLIKKLMKEDPEFKKGIEDIARKISDKYPETR